VASGVDPRSLAEQYAVVIRHLGWLQIHVERPTVYRLAAAWNGGVNAVNRGQFSNAMESYAHRVENLYNEEDEE
jgi:hypothetical protein